MIQIPSIKSKLSTAIILHVYCWWLQAPLVLLSGAAYLPFRIMGRLLYGRKPDEAKEANMIKVDITEAKGVIEPKDDILFIHGFPDSAEMWND
jgi:hypothetical protein